MYARELTNHMDFVEKNARNFIISRAEVRSIDSACSIEYRRIGGYSDWLKIENFRVYLFLYKKVG